MLSVVFVVLADRDHPFPSSPLTTEILCPTEAGVPLFLFGYLENCLEYVVFVEAMSLPRGYGWLQSLSTLKCAPTQSSSLAIAALLDTLLNLEVSEPTTAVITASSVFSFAFYQWSRAWPIFWWETLLCPTYLFVNTVDTNEKAYYSPEFVLVSLHIWRLDPGCSSFYTIANSVTTEALQAFIADSLGSGGTSCSLSSGPRVSRDQTFLCSHSFFAIVDVVSLVEHSHQTANVTYQYSRLILHLRVSTRPDASRRVTAVHTFH